VFVDLAAGFGIDGLSLLRSTSGDVFEWSVTTGLVRKVVKGHVTNMQTQRSNEPQFGTLACNASYSFYIKDDGLYCTPANVSLKTPNATKRITINGKKVQRVFAGRTSALVLSQEDGMVYVFRGEPIVPPQPILGLDCVQWAACDESGKIIVVHASYMEEEDMSTDAARLEKLNARESCTGGAVSAALPAETCSLQ
jgi:hypothetical protein